MKLPKQLQNDKFRFIPLNDVRHPIISGWSQTQQENNFKYNSSEIISHLENEGNIGIIGGYGNLVIIDFDTPEAIKEYYHILPKTFSVRSGGKRLPHFYYILDKPIKPERIRRGKIKIDIQGIGTYAVIPPSNHEAGTKYTVVNDVEIRYIETKTLFEFLQIYSKQEIIEKELTLEDLEADDYIGKLIRNDIQKGERNISFFKAAINLCKQDIPGWLALDYFKLKNKLLINPLSEKELIKCLKQGYDSRYHQDEEDNDTWVLSNIDLDNVPEIKFISFPFLQKGGLTYLVGSHGSMKSFFSLGLGLAASTGNKFFNNFQTDKSKVLLLDTELGQIPTQNRIKALGIKNTLKYKNFYCQNFVNYKVNTVEGKDKALNLIKRINPDILILDNIISLIEGDENKSTDVSRLRDFYNDCRKFNPDIAILGIHHTPKNSENKDGYELRGSSELPAQADAIFKIINNKACKTCNITCSKFRHAENTGLDYNFRYETENGIIKFNLQNEIEYGITEAQKVEEMLENEPNLDIVKPTTFARKYGFNRTTVRRILEKLKNEKVAQKVAQI